MCNANIFSPSTSNMFCIYDIFIYILISIATQSNIICIYVHTSTYYILIYIKNKNSPKTDPCETSVEMNK